MPGRETEPANLNLRSGESAVCANLKSEGSIAPQEDDSSARAGLHRVEVQPLQVDGGRAHVDGPVGVPLPHLVQPGGELNVPRV